MASEQSGLLNTREALPLYAQLRDRLRADILAGVYPVGGPIPSENALCAMYAVSRVTVRKALAELAGSGLLERRQGKGSFVAVPRLQRDLKHINSFNEACAAMGLTAQTRLIRAGLVHDRSLTPAESALLLSGGETEAVELVRLRLAGGEPVMLEINRFPPRYQWLLREDLSGSLYALLRAHGVTPDQATHEISLCHAAEADAGLLDVAPGTALLFLNEVIYDSQGQLLHTSAQQIRGDRFVFRI